MSKATTRVRNKKQDRREERKYNGYRKEGQNVKERRGHDRFFLHFFLAPFITLPFYSFQPQPRLLCETLKHFIGTLLEATVSTEGCGLYKSDKIGRWSRGSSVSIVATLRDGCPSNISSIRCKVLRLLSELSRPALVPTHIHVYPPGVKRRRGMKLTTYSHLIPTLRMCEDKFPFLHSFRWRVN